MSENGRGPTSKPTRGYREFAVLTGRGRVYLAPSREAAEARARADDQRLYRAGCKVPSVDETLTIVVTVPRAEGSRQLFATLEQLQKALAAQDDPTFTAKQRLRLAQELSRRAMAVIREAQEASVREAGSLALRAARVLTHGRKEEDAA